MKHLAINKHIHLENVIYFEDLVKREDLNESYDYFLKVINDLEFQQSQNFFMVINFVLENNYVNVGYYYQIGFGEVNKVDDLPERFQFNSYFQLNNVALTRMQTDEISRDSLAELLEKLVVSLDMLYLKIRTPFFVQTRKSTEIEDGYVFDAFVGTE